MKYQVSEKKIRQAIEIYSAAGAGDRNGFTAALLLGDEFRKAELHPFYVYDDDDGSLEVTSEEHVENRGN